MGQTREISGLARIGELTFQIREALALLIELVRHCASRILCTGETLVQRSRRIAQLAFDRVQVLPNSSDVIAQLVEGAAQLLELRAEIRVVRIAGILHGVARPLDRITHALAGFLRRCAPCTDIATGLSQAIVQVLAASDGSIQTSQRSLDIGLCLSWGGLHNRLVKGISQLLQTVSLCLHSLRDGIKGVRSGVPGTVHVLEQRI